MWLFLTFLSVATAEDPTQECAELSDRMEQILARVQELQAVTAPETPESTTTRVPALPHEDDPPSPNPTQESPAPPSDTSEQALDAVAESPG